MTYSRDNPSPRYTELQALYQAMHEQGETFLCVPPEQTFPGKSLPPQAARIKRLIDETSAQTILDYGSGKGLQYGPMRFGDASGQEWPSIVDYWDVDEVVCYDPCYAPFSRRPQGRFDGVISTDVLEHCPEQDMPWIVGELFSYATKFVFANVACYPAQKRLPNGENAHCTIKPPAWWADLLGEVSSRHPGVKWEVWVQWIADTAQGKQAVEQRIGGG